MPFHPKNIDCFLITTHHNRETRHDYIKDHLYSFNPIPVLAVDWKLFRHTNLNPEQYKQQSLTLAYYTACQTAVFADMEEFIIFEDDVQVSSNLLLVQYLDSLPHDFDLVYLSRTKHNIEGGVTKPYSDHYSIVVSNYWETPATFWSIEFAKKFIDYIENKLESGLWLGHIDHELMKILKESKPRFYCLNEQIIIGLSSEPEKAPEKLNLTNSISART